MLLQIPYQHTLLDLCLSKHTKSALTHCHTFNLLIASLVCTTQRSWIALMEVIGWSSAMACLISSSSFFSKYLRIWCSTRDSGLRSKIFRYVRIRCTVCRSCSLFVHRFQFVSRRSGLRLFRRLRSGIRSGRKCLVDTCRIGVSIMDRSGGYRPRSCTYINGWRSPETSMLMVDSLNLRLLDGWWSVMELSKNRIFPMVFASSSRTGDDLGLENQLNIGVDNTISSHLQAQGIVCQRLHKA